MKKELSKLQCNLRKLKKETETTITETRFTQNLLEQAKEPIFLMLNPHEVVIII